MLQPSRRWEATALLALAVGLIAGSAVRSAPVPGEKKPRVEVVFCLDTTGSMGGLIEGAKQKVWAICNQIASGKPNPDLKVGLVAYRDRGDAYITKVFDLTDDLDAVYGNLRGFQAQGGGDGPESVNQALAEAVDKIKWSGDKKTLRIIFLVGDAPPHMDYAADVKYPETCKKAVTRGILINSIQCGGDAECMRIWKDICAKAEGSYAQIPQTGGVVAVATPFDKRLGEINATLARSTLAFGRSEKKDADLRKAREAATLPAAAAADRAGFSAKGGKAASYDLLDAIRDKKVKLENLKEAELPKEMQKMTPKQRQEYLEKVEKERAGLRKEALELDRQRGEYIKKKLAETKKGGKDSFDGQVLDALRKQAKKHGIDY